VYFVLAGYGEAYAAISWNRKCCKPKKRRKEVLLTIINSELGA
jgi:hypothetical protein